MPTETRAPSPVADRSPTQLPRVTLVVAVADNGVIGRDGALPWRLPEDLRRFKTATLGHPIVMGRRTFESIGRALPGRPNLVLTRSTDWCPATGADTGVTIVHDWAGALRAAGEATELMVIGGAEIYAIAQPYADRVLLTRVHAAVEGDTWLTPFSAADWIEVRVEHFAADARNPIDMSFVELQRASSHSPAPPR